MPTGSIEYKTIFAVGLDALRADAADERVAIRLVRRYRRGVRVSAHAGRLCARRAALARRVQGSRLPRAAAVASCSALVVLGALLVDVLATASAPRLRAPHQLAVERPRRSPGASPAIIGHALADRRLRPSSASRSASAPRSTSRSTPTARRWCNRLHRAQHPEPRRRAVDRLRHPRPRLPRARPLSLGRVVLAGGADPRAARAADRDHRRARGDPRGAAVDPRGRARARRDAVADDLAQVLPAAIPGIATGVDPRALARDRRDGAADPRRRGDLHHVQPAAGRDGAFTALPIQIFNWISQPQDEFQPLAAAAIVVLLGILLCDERRRDLPPQPLREQVVSERADGADAMSDMTTPNDAGESSGAGRARAPSAADRRSARARRLRRRRRSSSCGASASSTAASRPCRTSRSSCTRTRSRRSSGRRAAASRRSCAASTA